MSANKIKDRINEICSLFSFEYNGIACGIDPLSVSEFNMWYGEDKNYTAQSIDEVMSVKLFDGNALNDIADEIDIIDF